MRKLEYQVSFNTPAFLGNADQQAQWRTPPFKALIRHWWRIVKAPEINYRIDVLRREEGRLFGVAADGGGDSRRSLVRFRLSDWSPGTLTAWDTDDKVHHPEVAHAGKPIGAQLYLGYGPLAYKAHKTALNDKPMRTAIAIGERKRLTVIVPDSLSRELEKAISLTAWFGALGSRSRNGWGALRLVSATGTPVLADLTPSTLAPFQRELAQCLDLDWPHAIGTEGDRPLIWRTARKNSWRELMCELAAIKIAFRTQPDLMSLAGVLPGSFAPRHLLAYPVTHHVVHGKNWGSQGRLANQLRFKPALDGQHWVGIIVHTPCRLPAEMLADLPAGVRQNFDGAALASWRQVHRVLDQSAHRMTSDD